MSAMAKAARKAAAAQKANNSAATGTLWSPLQTTTQYNNRAFEGDRSNDMKVTNQIEDAEELTDDMSNHDENGAKLNSVVEDLNSSTNSNSEPTQKHSEKDLAKMREALKRLSSRGSMYNFNSDDGLAYAKELIMVNQILQPPDKERLHPYGNVSVYEMVFRKKRPGVSIKIDSGKLCAWLTFFFMLLGIVVVLIFLSESSKETSAGIVEMTNITSS